VFAPKTNLAPANGEASRAKLWMSTAKLRMAGLIDRGYSAMRERSMADCRARLAL